MALPGVAGGGLAPDQPALFEIAQHARQIAGIEIERAADRACGGRIAAGDLVEHACFAERVGAVEKGFAQHADLARVEAIEAAHRRDAILLDAMVGVAMLEPARHEASLGQLLDKVKYMIRTLAWPV